MNFGIVICLLMGGSLLILAGIFALLREKGAILMSGFNSLPKAEREKYDQAKISKDMRNNLLIWSIIFLVGAIFSYFTSPYFAIIAFVVWLILLIKEMHFSVEKAFGKYKL